VTNDGLANDVMSYTMMPPTRLSRFGNERALVDIVEHLKPH